jgi:uncharacterized protein (DUF362 family)
MSQPVSHKETRNVYRVSRADCEDYASRSLEPALDFTLKTLGGLESFVRPAQKVILKPNWIGPFSSNDPAITNPNLLLALSRRLVNLGADVSIADSPAWGDAAKVARCCGMEKETERLGVNIVTLNQPRKIRLDSGAGVRSLVLDRRMLEADVVINVPKAKVHCQLVMTGAVKNLFGSVCGRRKALWHFRLGKRPEAFCAMLLEIMKLIRPAVTIVDAVDIMEGHGPTGGSSKRLGLLIAGENCLAVDRVLCEAMGICPQGVPVLQQAGRQELPGMEEGAIEIMDSPGVGLLRTPVMMSDEQPLLFSLPRIIRGALRQAVRQLSS